MKRFILLIIFTSTILQAELVLSKTLIEHQAKLSDTSFSQSIEIHNTGSESIKVNKIENSCTCTSVKISDKTIQAGQKATLSFSIEYKKNRGLLKNTLSLVTDQKTYKLTIKNHIPEEIDLHPRFLFWNQKTYGQERNIKITIHPDFEAQLITPESTENFSLSQATEKGKASQISVKLLGEFKKSRHKLPLQFKTKNGKTITRYVYFFIR